MKWLKQTQTQLLSVRLLYIFCPSVSHRLAIQFYSLQLLWKKKMKTKMPLSEEGKLDTFCPPTMSVRALNVMAWATEAIVYAKCWRVEDDTEKNIIGHR